MPAQRVQGLTCIAALLVLPFMISGCAPLPPAHAMQLHNTYIVEGLPQPEYEEAWYGVPLDNVTDSVVVIQSMRLSQTSNLVAGKPFVVNITNGDYIDWYAPPGTKRMQAEVANSVSIVGFEIPPHTRGRFQAIVLAKAREQTKAASVSGAVIQYEIDGHSQQETWLERASLTAPRK